MNPDLEQLLADLNKAALPDVRLDAVLRFSAIVDQRTLPRLSWQRLPLPEDLIVLPCPFCGHLEARIYRFWSGSSATYQVRCCCCSALGPAYSAYDNAIEFWNVRRLGRDETKS